MDGTIVVAILGIAGTFLAPLCGVLITQRGEHSKWKRGQIEKSFEYRRKLYSDFISSFTALAATNKDLTLDPGEDYRKLANYAAQIQVACPKEVSKAAQSVIKTFQDASEEARKKGPAVKVDIDKRNKEWQAAMDSFIFIARQDVLNPGQSKAEG